MMPALIIAFINYEAVKRRLEELRAFGIHDIYVYVDGYNHDGNIQRLQQRKRLIEMLEKELSLSRLLKVHFCETNTGVGIAVPAAVDWFFQNVEYGMILEDDCILLPNRTSVLLNAKDMVDKDQKIIVCLSQPMNNSDLLSAQRNNLFVSSVFFTSWGWITNRITWTSIGLREIQLSEVFAASVIPTRLSVSQRLWLQISWIDIWLSLRANQQRLWAFRFTIMVILNKITVVYPLIKTVQHSPGVDATNVKLLPKWDLGIEDTAYIDRTDLRYEVLNFPNLDAYICNTIQGGTFRSLIVRVLFRIAKKLRIK